MEEIAGEAALYADPNSPEEIAEQMKRLYKDENLRSRLIEAGNAIKGKYNWQKTADEVWQLILAAAKK